MYVLVEVASKLDDVLSLDLRAGISGGRSRGP